MVLNTENLHYFRINPRATTEEAKNMRPRVENLARFGRHDQRLLCRFFSVVFIVLSSKRRKHELINLPGVPEGRGSEVGEDHPERVHVDHLRDPRLPGTGDHPQRGA